MSKIFGYTKKGGQDWFISDAYSDKEIESIKDPEGGSEISLPTAIPSPFARIDLVKTAFINIVKSPKLTAYTKDSNVVSSKDDEKLVSEALDLAEIMFNIDSIKDKVKIIVWDKKDNLAALKGGSMPHKQLAETIELYLEQDKESYNFDLLNCLYLIECNYKIIGCTSPSTLFFATANDLSHAQFTFAKNNKTFSGEYTPLYKRDAEFQKYMYMLFQSSLYKNLKVITKYLVKNKQILDKYNNTLYNEVNGLDSKNFLSNYAELTSDSGYQVEVIGVPLRKQKKGSVTNAIQSSDFIIQSDKCKEETKPLVLQNNFNKPFKYVNDTWDKSIVVPYVDGETVLEKRQLPGVNMKYAYLTVSDFLEPYLIRLVYPINKDKFFDGNVITDIGDDSKSYILPLKQKFFDYFDTDDLVKSSQNSPEITMNQGVGGAVKVKLRIPIEKHGEFISFERMYYPSPDNQFGKPDETKNKGVIIEHQFSITLFPFIKTNDPNIHTYYRIQLVDRNLEGILKNTNYDLKFYANKDQNEIKVKARKDRQRAREDLDMDSDYYVLENEFDYIQVKNNVSTGIIIPNWQPYRVGDETFSFAIDFGTTNTHIEYKIGNESPKPLDITTEDIQIATLFHPTKTTLDFGGTSAGAIRESVEQEFVPWIIGNGSEYKFPHRTVIANNKNCSKIEEIETFSLADFNIPFIYEKKYGNDEIQSNLKWGNKEKGNEKRVKAFFENLIMLMHNKVLLNNGNLSKAKIVWFYPASMKPVRKAALALTWNELIDKYFKLLKPANGIVESLAPFYYYKGTNQLQGGTYTPVVSIDIGGGTTDVVVFKQNKPLLLTSFKFAANTIFGDGYSEYGTVNSNGIINKYCSYFEKILLSNRLSDLSEVLTDIKDKNKSEDLNAFFFSIENNLKDKDMFSFNTILSKDEDLKIIFIYFYTAIIYHIAELMKQKQVELPKHIIFSGTGSKILTIITPNKEDLAEFSKVIFQSVFNEKFDEDGLTIEAEKEIPKEVTCKGGLMLNPEDLSFDVRKIKTILSCVENKGISKLTYDKLDEDIKQHIVIYVKDFNSFFLSINKEFNFSDNFGVSEKSMEVFKKELNKHLRDYLEDGLVHNKKLDNVGTDDKELEESLFFYPLIGTINNLITQLSELSPK